MYEFLPALLNQPQPIPQYTGYKTDLPPQVAHLFAAAAFRFAHSIVPPGMLLRQKATPAQRCLWRREVGGYAALRLCQNWWNAQDIVLSYGVDEILLGMAGQITERADNIVVTDLRGETRIWKFMLSTTVSL
jgi:dual oxidase